MKCYICDKQLANDEIKHAPAYGHGGFDPCGTCLEIISEIFEPLDEDEIDFLLSTEEGQLEDSS